mmetsp:Transcript_41988/g.121743  ORF Transcript_41988/g.121743 Transcript_41988/m.121743 type:complete len:227 (+) Transcript_41988:150-830(+)
MSNTEANVAWQRAEQLKRDVDSVLEQLATQRPGAGGAGGSAVALQQRLGGLANEFRAAVQHAREQADNLSDAKGRMVAQRKVERLEHDMADIQSAVEKQLGHFYRARKQEEDRERLFGKGDKRVRGGGPDDEMRSMVTENSALRDANSQLQQILDQGQAIVGNLVDQNKVLKNVKKKVLDAASSLGISKGLVNVIDRRNKEDQWLVYGGIALTLFILFSLWYLLRW